MTFEPSKEPVRITDHAVLRYLERAMGLNIEMVREHILQLCVAPAAFGAVCVRAEGLRFEIVGNSVVSVTPDNILPSNITRDRNREKMARASA